MAHYNGPAGSEDLAVALALHANGNVHVTGRSTSFGTDYFATVKYDAEGNPLWVARSFGFTPTAMALDAERERVHDGLERRRGGEATAGGGGPARRTR